MTKTDDFKITNAADQRVDAQPGAAPHPGSFIRNEVLAPLGLKVAPACVAMGLNRPSFVRMLDGKGPLTRDVAYRLEALTGLNADLIIGMQALHDRGKEMPLRQKYREQITRWEPAAAASASSS